MSLITIKHRIVYGGAMVIMSFGLIGGGCGPAGKTEIGLKSKAIHVTFSETTGQIQTIVDPRHAGLLTASSDHYDLDGALSTEEDDVVVSKKIRRNEAVFECRNKEVGISVKKTYRLNGNVLAKEVVYGGVGAERLLLKIASESRIEPQRYRDGYYYTPTDDGYKVSDVPFTAGAALKEPKAWTFSTGQLVYYLPKENRVFAHYVYKVNGDYVYCETPYSGAAESKFFPGGAVNALAQDFVDAKSSVTVESRYVVLEGDVRDYHRHIFGQSPYLERRNVRAVPEWFPKARMFTCSSAQELLEQPDQYLQNVKSFLKLLRDDEYVMLFFNHWTANGDYPHTGTIRYMDYAASRWSKPVPIEKLKEGFARLKALSPKIKIGGYFAFVCAEGTEAYEKHPDWFLYDKAGQRVPAGGGGGNDAVPDFLSGYRPYVADQIKHMVTDVGFDWLHFDCIPTGEINWKPRRVVQTADTANVYREMADFCLAHDAAIVMNMQYSTGLWMQGSYFECAEPDRYERNDWRILGAQGYLAALYRTYRPGAWVNLCYGATNIYGRRNAYLGMRGWIRGADEWWSRMPTALAYEDVANELLDMPLSEARVSPSWWRLETKNFEAEVLQKGGGILVPMILHGEQPAEETISLPTAPLGIRRGNCLFGFDFLLFHSTGVNVFRPVPLAEDVVSLTAFEVDESPAPTHTHRIQMEPMRNAYHAVTAVPGWVYSYNGRRTMFLLPENQGVKIEGTLGNRAKKYRLVVENRNRTAQILAYVPAAWKGAAATVGGKSVDGVMLDIKGKRCLRLDVAQGQSKIVVAEAEKTAAVVPYENPRNESWRIAAERLWARGVTLRAYAEDGKSCLAIKAPPGGGNVEMPYSWTNPKAMAGGFAVKIKGANAGARLKVTLVAGDVWAWEGKDDFTGWKEFTIYKEAMTCAKETKKWQDTSTVYLTAYPAGDQEIHLADFHLLPARKGDIVEEKAVKRKLVAYRVDAPPVIDGQGNDACWKDAPVATDFFLIGGKRATGRTEVKVCYDDENLYVFFNNVEPIVELGPKGKETRDSNVWKRDHVELYLDPYRDGYNWVNLLVDAADNIQDLCCLKTGYSDAWTGDFEVKTALNWKAAWCAEYKVPFKTLGRTPKDGDVWGATFGRLDMTGEWSNWALTAGWQEWEKFGDLEFAGKKK